MRFAPIGGSTGPATWGAITGTLAAQTDLGTAIDARVIKHARHYEVAAGTSVQAVIDAAVSAGHTDANPCWIRLMEPRTENLTLAPGVFLTGGETSGTHAPIVLTGSVTMAATSGTLTANHYALERLSIIGPSGGAAILFGGTAPQRLFLRDLWLTAQGAGYCMSLTNSNATSHVVQADDLKLSHNGTGWCLNCATSSLSIDKVETSGAVGVAHVGTGATLNIAKGECDANSTSAFDVEAGGVLTLGDCIVKNTAADSYGVRLISAGAQLSAVGTMFDVPAGAGYAVLGGVGTVYASAFNLTMPGTNNKFGNGLTAVYLGQMSDWVDVPYGPNWTTSTLVANCNRLQCMRDPSGFVCIRGVVDNVGAGTDLIGTLPAAYRPATKIHYFPSLRVEGASLLGVQIRPDGTITTGGVTLDGIFLDHIRFDPR